MGHRTAGWRRMCRKRAGQVSDRTEVVGEQSRSLGDHTAVDRTDPDHTAAAEDIAVADYIGRMAGVASAGSRLVPEDRTAADRTVADRTAGTGRRR